LWKRRSVCDRKGIMKLFKEEDFVMKGRNFGVGGICLNLGVKLEKFEKRQRRKNNFKEYQ